jgi:hypothetical protein
MAFRLGDLLITVIHPELSDSGEAPPPPHPPMLASKPNWIDDVRAAVALASATLEAQERMLAPPQTLVEATALEQHLVRALREVREVKDQLAKASTPSAPGDTGTDTETGTDPPTYGTP